MGKEDSVNKVSKTNSNGNSTLEKTLDNMTEKKDLDADKTKLLENNGVKDLKEDDVIKEIEQHKKADGVEEVEHEKKVDGGEEVKEDKRLDKEEVKEDNEVDCAEVDKDKKDDGMKEEEEDKKDGGVEEIKEDGKYFVVNEAEDNKKNDNGSENKKMDEGTELKKTAESKEEEDKVETEKPELDVMEENGIPGDKEESSEKEKIKELKMEEEDGEDEDKVDKSKEEKAKNGKIEKGLKKRGKGKTSGEKAKRKGKEVKETEPRTPAIDRPVRERKSVERLVASIEKDAAKEFHIEKGRGTALKDIPNVAFKLSRRKTDDTFKLLHTILFGRRGKAVQIKSNISRFSGFVWHENEEKQMIKAKEKFDKCNKEKLLEFCDVFDIPLAKATTRKEDIVAKLIDFLVAPQATTTVLLAEKEKSNKGKRKRIANQGLSRSGTTTSKRFAKSRKKNEDSSAVEERKSATDTEDEAEEEQKDEENEKENETGVPDKSEDEKMPEQSESEDKSDSENESEDVKKPKKNYKTTSTKKEPAAKSKTKKITVTKKSRSKPKRMNKKLSSARSKFDDDNSDGSPRVFSRKKRNEKVGKEKTSTPSKSSSKEKSEKVTKGKGKNKEKLNPTDDQLRDAVCEILKEVDFNTATFTDILKQLAEQFDMDLTPRKASIKLIIQEELTKLADEDGEGDADNDETQSTGQEVEA